MPVIRLPEEAAQYKNEWVTFSMDLTRMISHHPDLVEAVAQAKNLGEEEVYPLFIPDEWPETLNL